MSPPRDSRREPDDDSPSIVARRDGSSARFDTGEIGTYGRHKAMEQAAPLMRDSGPAQMTPELLEQIRMLGFHQGASEVSGLREKFDEHCTTEAKWQGEVDRKLDRVVDGLGRIESSGTELRSTVNQHEQYVQQARGAAVASKIVWVLIGTLASAIIWVFSHLTTTTPSTASARPAETAYTTREPAIYPAPVATQPVNYNWKTSVAPSASAPGSAAGVKP